MTVKPCIYVVKDKAAFKRRNLENWHSNSEFWLQGRMRHLQDVADLTSKELSRLLSEQVAGHGISEPTLFDIGCGEGWIYRLVHDKHLRARYVGIDFNDQFISELRARYGESDDHKFYCLDLEIPPPAELIGRADVAVNFFNFFEIPDIDAAFGNVASMMRMNASLLVVNIDPVMQILAVSSDHASFIENLKLYEEQKHELGYDKDIDVGDEPSGRVYKSLLYSTATYVALGRRFGLRIEDYREVIKTGNSVPQIYQFLYFRKISG